MIIELTTPLNPGDMSSDIYDHVKMVRYVHDYRRKAIRIELEYGTISGSDWVPGDITPHSSNSNYPTHVRIRGSKYNTLRTTHLSNDGERTLHAIKRAIFEYLTAGYPLLAGTLV